MIEKTEQSVVLEPICSRPPKFLQKRRKSTYSNYLSFTDKINLPLFSTVVPACVFMFLSRRPFVAITTLSTGFVGVEVTSVSLKVLKLNQVHYIDKCAELGDIGCLCVWECYWGNYKLNQVHYIDKCAELGEIGCLCVWEQYWGNYKLNQVHYIDKCAELGEIGRASCRERV